VLTQYAQELRTTSAVVVNALAVANKRNRQSYAIDSTDDGSRAKKILSSLEFISTQPMCLFGRTQMATHPLVPAAQYVRMSTEHQQYSLENQSTAIQRYAESHGFEVVHTYSDAARSDLVRKHRTGLRQMLQGVVGGTPAYLVILVYDVSRWGRFQDSDESAHYEFLYKSAGIPVHYCAEIHVAFYDCETVPLCIFFVGCDLIVEGIFLMFGGHSQVLRDRKACIH
jgi:hypothetical protein